MTIYNKPSDLPAWAESGDKVQPSNAEIQTGWPLSTVPPSRQRFNWLLNWLATGVRYFMQRGIPEWDATEEYPAGARVQYNDVTYISLSGTSNIGEQPDTATIFWERWGYSESELSAFNDAYLSKSVAGAVDVTLTAAEARKAIFNFTGALTANINVIIPAAAKRFIVRNNTSGAFSLTVKTLAGTGVIVAQTKSNILGCDGTNVFDAKTDLNIVDASDTVKGVVELATNAEVQTGTDTIRAVTPAGLLFAGKRYRNLTNIGGATVLTAADVGTVVLCGGAGSYNVTIPDADNFVTGQTITIGSQTAVVTLIPSGTDNFSDSGDSIATYTIPAGGFVELTRFGASFWVITNKNLYIGVGQTWQSLSGSRALATTYTNTTSRPIMVNVYASYTTGNGLQLVINGVAVARSSGNSATVIYSTLSGIVPVGATYSVSFFAGSEASDLQWLELR